MADLVTIVVPVYNVQNYLARCIESLINQTYKNIEILLIDDGSNDDSAIICDEYQEKDERISVYHKENGGLSSARNYGIERAHGTYIAFIDSDDWIENRFVERLMAVIQEDNSNIACCGFKIVNENNIIVSEKCSKESFVLSNISALENILLDGCVKNVAWNKIYEKNLFNEVRYPEGKNYEDVATTYKLILKAQKVSVVNESLNNYFLRSDSIIHTVSERNINNWIWAYTMRKQEIAGRVNPEIEMIGDILFHYNLAKCAKRSKGDTVMKIGNKYQKILKKEIKCCGVIQLYKKVNDFSLIGKILFVAWLL